MQYFITGVSGFIGKRLVRKLLAQEENTVYFLMREESRGKLPELIEYWGGKQERAIPVFGDVRKPALGLTPQDIASLNGRIDHFFHLAAIYDLNAQEPPRSKRTWLAANASAVITNVKGSGEPKYLAGKRIERHIFWVPQSGGIGLGISILSYAGKIDFGVMSDAKRIPHPAAIVQGFVDEYEELLLAVLLMPWPTDARPPKALGLDGRGKAASSEDAVGVSKGRKRPDKLRHTSMKPAARTSFGMQ